MARILVVDDNRDVAQSLASLLRCDAHEVVVAYSGADALQIVETGQFELILLDLVMPGMDGFAVARQLRAQASAGRLCIVALTGYWSPLHGRDRYLFDDYLLKPIGRGQIEAALAASLIMPQPGIESSNLV